MKRRCCLPLVVLLHLRADAARVGAPHRPRRADRATLARRSVDFSACRATAAKFLDSPVPAARAIEKAMDFCALEGRILDSNYACPHFREAITRALEPGGAEALDAAAFCRATEAYVLSLRGAARVPRTGSGPLLGFRVSPACAGAVAAAFAPEARLASASVPDFWYAMCMNQDCAHFLPSRTRWCDIQRQPTHSATVCEAARRFALDEVLVHETKTMSPEQICALYGEFVKEMGIDVDAYEHVMHNDSVRSLPVPDDQTRTLLSSQMVNDAKVHYIRDHMASPIEQDHGSQKGQLERVGGLGTARSLAQGMAGVRAVHVLTLLFLWTLSIGLMLDRA
mmetsp:Transcript_108408/g.317162  ORF Transcript_108408/g.317162 Transcript_108408/m.317162 type:complete len:338 (-) Transcript_108408:96-1109(-)